MDISLEHYESLIAYARKLCKGYHIDPFEVVHEMLVLHDCNLGKQHVKRSFYIQRERQMEVLPLTAASSKNKRGTPLIPCTKCHEPFPGSAYYVNGRGRLMSYCSTCRKALHKKWRDGIIDKTAFNAKNRDRQRRFYQTNPGKKKEYQDRYITSVKADPIKYKKFRKRRNEELHKFYETHPSKKKEYRDRYITSIRANPDKYKKFRRKRNAAQQARRQKK